MRLGIIIIVSIATTSCNSIKEDAVDGATPPTKSTNQKLSPGNDDSKQSNFTYEIAASERIHVEQIIAGYEALGVISEENKKSCYSVTKIGKVESEQNGKKKIQIFLIFEEVSLYTIVGSTVSPNTTDDVQSVGDQPRFGTAEKCLKSKSVPTDTASQNTTVLVATDDKDTMEGNVTFFEKKELTTGEAGGRLTRHQVLVISTCSAIIGTFFLVAAIIRIRNYIKRLREEQATASRPTFRSCSVALRNSNNTNGEQREEIVRKESTGSKASVKQSNHGNKPVTINFNENKDDQEENPLLTQGDIEEDLDPEQDDEEDVDLDSDNEGEYECEMAPLVKQQTILEDIMEVSEHSSPAKHSIGMAEEVLQQHMNTNQMVPQPTEFVLNNMPLHPLQEGATYIEGLGLSQSDSSVASQTNPSYKYGNQTEYVSGGGYGNFAYSPGEEVRIPMLQDDIEQKILESPEPLDAPHDYDFSPVIIPGNYLNSPDESHNGILNSSSSDNTSRRSSSSSRESSDSSPRPGRMEHDPLSDYTFYQQSISDRLNEMNDELFDDMLGPDEDRSIRMAELSEFSSLPTIPESSHENTDAEDYENRMDYPVNRNSWMSNRSYSSDSHDSRGRAAPDQKHPNTNGSVLSNVQKDDPQKDATNSQVPSSFVRNENNAYDNDIESSDNDLDLDMCDDPHNRSHIHIIDERTLLLSSFEGMESTLV